MKIAVTDACIFIDLIELKLTSEFFALTIEIHTSLDVINELYPDQKEILKAYQSVGKLYVHNLSSEEKIKIHNGIISKALSDNDKTVIYLADKLNAIILSSDKAVRNFAKSKAIEYHGMLWIFDMLVELNLINSSKAIANIEFLFSRNIIYQNNTELISEKEKRINNWKKK
jgi:predicted nucleic acid-binding protein